MSLPNHVFRVPIKSDTDIVVARQKGRALAVELGFAGSAPTVIAAAISEVARNIVDHAQDGEIILSCVQQNGRQGLQVVARDAGPGIADVDQAMQYGYSTGKGLGVGLPGVKMLMDDFEIKSRSGAGTEVTVRKWLT
jgi:serine/threonine-protein kinase RsbT